LQGLGKLMKFESQMEWFVICILASSNPNEHHRQDSVLVASKERNRFRSITWENYDPVHQKYLEIGMSHSIIY